MWNLKSIEGKRIFSFEAFKYDILQNNATLIFGNNMDNDSQNSNGSGKSALIEAIAISLTGDSLRKVNANDIINDRFDDAQITAELYSTDLNIEMRIERSFVRDGSQTINVYQTNEDGTEERIVQASILDYNRYILDTIGLTKDDIYSNFILTAKKFKSFLSSSDKEKKEIINRFSNGILVDESIEALQKDMEPVKIDLSDAEKNVATCEGKLSAINEEIEKAIDDANNRIESRRQRIEGWKQAIVDKTTYIRVKREYIGTADNRWNTINNLDGKLKEIKANTSRDFSDTYKEVKEIFDENDLLLEEDYDCQMAQLKKSIDRLQSQLDDAALLEKAAKREQDIADKTLQEVGDAFETESEELCKKDNAIKDKLGSISIRMEEIQDKEENLKTNLSKVTEEIAHLNKLLSGVIVCPNCKHEFVIDANVDVQEKRTELGNAKAGEQSLKDSIASLKLEYNKCDEEKRAAREESHDIFNAQRILSSKLKAAEDAVSSAKRKYNSAAETVSDISVKLHQNQRKLETVRENLFEDAFGAIWSALRALDAKIKQQELDIKNAEGAISSYAENIKDAENATDDDMLSSLKQSKEKYQYDLQKASIQKANIERRYNALKVQEANFNEFKTYLANIKIDAIGEITNNFLETIGSDIRVKLSGYTMLKSGKVRDKISVSLMRDGVDCGAYEKFSKGEQTRVELASILAMHKLTNVNCETGKGLNLLVFDEILDATDEQGLANVFKALNNTQVTSLVVSHGLTSESYPNRLIVNKQNGTSFIN